MVSLRKYRKKGVQLDADWLLGPDSSTTDAMASERIGPSSDSARRTPIPAHGVHPPHEPDWLAAASDHNAPVRSSVRLACEGQRAGWLFRGIASTAAISVLILGIFQWDSIQSWLSNNPWLALPLQADTSEDTLRTMMELSAMATHSNAVLIEQLTTEDAESRLVAFQSLFHRIDGLSTDRASLSQRIALVQMLQSLPTKDPEVYRMRGLLASHLLRGLTLNDPAIQSSREALVSMLDSSTPDPETAIEIETTSASSDETASTSSQDSGPRSSATMAVMRGLEKLTLEQVLRLVQSRQMKLVKAATLELRRRGFGEEKLEHVFALANGPPVARLDALEKADQRFGADGVPLLIWMAETAEGEVRARAISLLSAKSDARTIPALRALQSRETDARIATQIDAVLLASGSNLSGER